MEYWGGEKKKTIHTTVLGRIAQKIYLGLEGIPLIVINFNSLMTMILQKY